MRLTKAQREMLNRARIYTVEGAGVSGAVIFGDQVRTAMALVRRGLARRTMPGSGAAFGRLVITDAGRAALQAAS